MTRLTQSYVHGASLTPLIGDTIGVHLDRMAGLSPDRLALVVRHQKIRWTYGEFRQKVDALAAGLVALGLKPGDRVRWDLAVAMGFRYDPLITRPVLADLSVRPLAA
jgi:non-ribosomal peptide synthetase component E (peptide arylation enzyme)